jgi:hypothetical protein
MRELVDYEVPIKFEVRVILIVGSAEQRRLEG